MSRSHIRAQNARAKRWTRREVAMAAMVLAVMAIVLVARLYRFPFVSSYKTASAVVLDVRTVPWNGVENGREQTRYRVELRVRYEQDGQTEDRWLPVNDETARRLLADGLAARPTVCVVYWPPRHPENARCRLDEQTR